MRKALIFAVFLLILLPATPSSALPLQAVSLKGGVYHGTQDYDFGGQKLFDPDARWTGTGGLSLEWKFGRKSNFRLLTEAIYLPEEIEEDIAEFDDFGQPTGRLIKVQGGLDYLTIPVLAKLQTADQASSLYFLVGLSVDFVVRRDDILIFGDFKDTVVSAQVGAGIENRLSPHWGGLLEFRYIQNIYSAYGGDDLGPDVRLNSVRQRGFTLLIGLRFLMD